MYTKAGTIFWVQTFEFRYFWGFSEKNIFGGMMKLWTFFGGSSQLGFFFWGEGVIYIIYILFRAVS